MMSTRGPVGLTRIANLKMKVCDSRNRLYCNGPAREELRYCVEGSGEEYVPAVSAGKEKNNFFKSRYTNLLFNFESILTLKGPSFSDSGTARGGGGGRGWNLPPSLCNFGI